MACGICQQRKEDARRKALGLPPLGLGQTPTEAPTTGSETDDRDTPESV